MKYLWYTKENIVWFSLVWCSLHKLILTHLIENYVEKDWYVEDINSLIILDIDFFMFLKFPIFEISCKKTYGKVNWKSQVSEGNVSSLGNWDNCPIALGFLLSKFPVSSRHHRNRNTFCSCTWDIKGKSWTSKETGDVTNLVECLYKPRDWPQVQYSAFRAWGSKIQSSRLSSAKYIPVSNKTISWLKHKFQTSIFIIKIMCV